MCNSQKESGPSVWETFLESPMSFICLLTGLAGSVGVYFNMIFNGDAQIAAGISLLASLASFYGFWKEYSTKSDEEREEANAMFPMHAFVLGIMASIAPNIISPEKIPWINHVREPLGAFVINLLWQLVAFYKLDVKKSMELKKRKSRQLTLIVNGETFTLVDKDGKPICLPPPDEKERETD